jgi:hypothetical protein
LGCEESHGISIFVTGNKMHVGAFVIADKKKTEKWNAIFGVDKLIALCDKKYKNC